MRVFEIDGQVFRDLHDGRGWMNESETILDEQQNYLIEIAYLESTSTDNESAERCRLLLDVYRISRQLTTPSLGLLLTTAKTLRE